MPPKSPQHGQELKKLPIDSLESNPFQPRDRIKKEDIQELSDSIKNHGIVEPLVVARTPAGYQIIAGERRWRAAMMAGLEEVPASIIKTTPRQMLELALVENVQRQNLHAIERAKGFQQLLREFDLSIKEIAQRISKSQSYVSNSLRLLGLPDLIKDAVIDGSISEGHARALASLEVEEDQIQTYKEIVDKKASVRGAEEMVRKIKAENEDVPEYLKRPPAKEKNEQIEVIKRILEDQCRSPIKVSLRRSGVQTRVSITLRGTERQTDLDLKKILNFFKK